MRKNLVFMLGILLFFLLFSCAKEEGREVTYLAKVGNVKITKDVFKRELEKLPDFAKQMFTGKEGNERFLNELVKRELLYQEAKKRGLDKDREYQEKVDDFKKITLIGQLLEKEIENKVKVTDQDVRDYYDQNREDFSPFSKIRLSLIRVRTEEEAKDISERLKKGEDFAEIARKYSIDTSSAKKGGDLGFLSRDQMDPKIKAIATRLRKGEISKPFKSDFGYDIIKITDKQLGEIIEFGKVKNYIQQHLTAERQKEVFDSYIEDLKKNYKVQINEEALAKLTAEEEKGQGQVKGTQRPPQEDKAK